MAGYDSIKAAIQDNAHFQNAADLAILEALIEAENFGQFKDELENNFAFWHAIDATLFDAHQKFALAESDAFKACQKCARQRLFAVAEEEFKAWFEGKASSLSYHLREQLYVMAESFATEMESPEGLNSDLVHQFEEKAKKLTGLKEDVKEEWNAFAVYLQSQLADNLILKGYFDEQLMQLARCDTVEAMQELFDSSELFKRNDESATVVNDETVPQLAKTAAVRLMHSYITICDDMGALDALVSVKNLRDLKKVLADYPVFGMSEDVQQVVLKGLHDDSAIPTIQALALISKKIHSVSKEELKELIEISGKESLMRAYKPENASAKEERILADYFQSSVHQVQTQNHALVMLTQAVLEEMDTDDFDAFATDVHEEIGEGADDLLEQIQALDKHKIQNYLRMLQINEGMVHAPEAAFQRVYDLIPVEHFVRNKVSPFDKINHLNDVRYRENQGMGALSATQVQAVAFRLMKQILEQQPGFSQALAGQDGKDKASCEKFLRRDGRLTNFDWLTTQNFQALQKRAVLIEIKRKLSGKHPALESLIQELPLAQQQQILQKADVYLPFLTQEKDERRIRDILGPDNAKLSVASLIAENKRIELLDKIHNAALKELIAARSELPLTEDFVDKVNKRLRELDPGHPITADEVNTFLNSDLVPRGGEQFNIDDAEAINQQYQFNAEIYAITPLSFEKYQTLLNFLLSINKTTVLKNDPPPGAPPLPAGTVTIGRIRWAFSKAESLAALKASTNPLPAPLLAQLTPTLFQQIKEESFKNELVSHFADTMEEDRKAFFKPLKKRFSLLQEEEAKTHAWFGERKSIHTQLEKMARLDLKSIQLSFQSAPLEDYEFYLDYLDQLEAACDLAIPELKDELALLEAHIASLQSANVGWRHEEERDTYIHELAEQLALVRTELTLHEKVKLALRGDKTKPADSLAYKGAFQVLKESRTHQEVLPEDTFSGYTLNYDYYKNTEREEALAVTATTSTAPAKGATSISSVPLGAKDKVLTKERKSGSSQVIRLTRDDKADEEVARFIEEPRDNGNKLTVAKFPARMLRDRSGAQTLNPDYIIASFAAAESFLLQRQAKGIGPDVPIVINGKTKDEVEGLYYALRTILKKYPQNGLTERSIKFGDFALDCYTPPSFLGKSTDPDLASEVAELPGIQRRVDHALKAWSPMAKRKALGSELLSEMDRKISMKEELNTLRTEASKHEKESLLQTPALKSVDEDVEETNESPRMKH